MQLRRTDGLADTGQVNRLPARHALKAGGLRQHAAQQRLHAGGHGAVVWGQQLKGQGLQRIPTQQSHGLSKLNMNRRLPPSKDVIIHAGHVIVNERIRMNELERASRS